MRDTVETKVQGGMVGEIEINTAEQLNADSDLLLRRVSVVLLSHKHPPFYAASRISTSAHDESRPIMKTYRDYTEAGFECYCKVITNPYPCEAKILQ